MISLMYRLYNQFFKLFRLWRIGAPVLRGTGALTAQLPAINLSYISAFFFCAFAIFCFKKYINYFPGTF